MTVITQFPFRKLNDYQEIIKEGRWYKVRTSERTWLPGVFPNEYSAIKALKMYNEAIENKQKNKRKYTIKDK